MGLSRAANLQLVSFAVTWVLFVTRPTMIGMLLLAAVGTLTALTLWAAGREARRPRPTYYFYAATDHDPGAELHLVTGAEIARDVLDEVAALADRRRSLLDRLAR